MMQNHFNNPEFSDIELILRDTTGDSTLIYAHRVILADNSEFFRSMMTCQFREAGQRRVVVEVPNFDQARHLIQWMYTKEPYFPLETLELAEQWLVPGAVIPERIPYPGPSGTFVKTEDKQTIKGHFVEFWAQPSTAVIRGLRIFIYNYGFLQIKMTFNGLRVAYNESIRIHKTYSDDPDPFPEAQQKTDRLCQYLAQHDIHLSPSDLYQDEYTDTGPDSRRQQKLIELILRNNTFTDEDQAFLRNLWKPMATK